MILYYWAQENPLISYRQGMNEILAIIMFAFYAEWVPKQTHNDEIATPEEALNYLHDEQFLSHDIYTLFERIMDLGIKELYGTNSDLS